MYRHAALAVAVGLAMLVGSGRVSGQETEAELERSIDSLSVLVDEAGVAARTARAARDAEDLRRAQAEHLLDTVRVAGMTIVSRVGDAAEAGELFAETWDESFRGYRSPALDGRLFTYQRMAYTVAEIPVAGRRERVAVPTWQSREQAKARIRSSISRVLAGDLDGSALGAWVRVSPLGERASSYVYRQMVLARSAAVDRCLSDDVASCTAALGLGPDGQAIDVWYSPEERRVRALEAADYEERRGSSLSDVLGRSLGRCVDDAMPDACDELLAGDPDSFIPLTFSVRATLANRALKLGGEGAWARLVQDPSMTPEEALASAAGVSLEELIADWRAWVVRGRPEVQAGLGGDSALAVLWVLFLAALATRSTRWRFA